MPITSTPRRLFQVLRYFMLLLFTLGLMACGPYHPMGISDEEWQTLTPDQRMQAREQQAEVDKARAAERAEKARIRAEKEAREQAIIAERRANPQYGERVQCILSAGQAKLNRKWRNIEPVAVDLVIGESQAIDVRHLRDGRTRYSRTGYASFDGQRVNLCLHSNSSPTSNYCASLLATTRQFDRGVSQNIQSKDFVRGNLRCDLVLPELKRRYNR
ncbi:hypothetical protein [Thiomicrospira sp.]|uniref:hypothetical protein n=1 Tax=Thiomicrospira sp. TaxID=935 RepID=UPI002F92FEEA